VVSISYQGHPKPYPVTQKIGGGAGWWNKNKEVRGDSVYLFVLRENKHNSSQLILRKISKIVSSRCHILRLQCTKFYFGWSFAPEPTGGAHSVPPDSLTGFEGSSKGTDGNERERGGMGRKDSKGREGKERTGKVCVMAFGGWIV